MPLPSPEKGLVISYAYLWARELKTGLVEGRKDRPCVVLSVVAQPDGIKVTVAPITHVAPQDARTAIEIPTQVKTLLGLDSNRSWVVTEEANYFTWPGYDLKPIPTRGGNVAYGFLPPKLFNRIASHFLEIAVRQRRIINRDN